MADMDPRSNVDGQDINPGSVRTEKASIDKADLRWGDADDKIDDRSTGTVYQNTTGVMLRVSVDFEVLNDNGSVIAYSGVSQYSSVPISQRWDNMTKRGLKQGDIATTSLLVPDGDYYKIQVTTDNESDPIVWRERELGR